ncbi:MAG TPA: hypothetical protein VFR70_09570 [Flavobacterium sp.]|nr:hypothetical protein [Flavobacterium sp.]
MKIATRIKSALLFLCALLFLTDSAVAQSTSNAGDYKQGFRLGFGISGGLIFDDPYDFALGADARLQYDLSQKTSITLTTGFSNLFVGDDIKDLGFIPVKAGFKAFVWEDRFYVIGEAGGAFAVTNDYDDTSLVLAPGIGYANKFFDASIRYEHYSDFPSGNNDKGVGQIALRLAYGFKL